ncbi:hypothetical protein PC129_g8726 [Phytophthora cactorum]|uniref:Armadillo-type fold n=1 Tax=Phytophthora cactorum TaxID=29920 RepID=A0A8T1I9Q3_9STRA|nr:hypothetical protein PC114_g1101 [Phytophthora cactorum]KAG3220498.1 hypothetical protein PC129_g8726 [Phytophthora cactorum]
MHPFGQDKHLLRNITAQLKPGRMVAFMADAGAAKRERKVILCAVGLIAMRGVQTIARTGSSDPECSRYASMMLTNVSAHRQNRLVVVERHALRPLRALRLTPNLECQRSAALALYNVSCAQANQLKFVEAGLSRHLFDWPARRTGTSNATPQ